MRRARRIAAPVFAVAVSLCAGYSAHAEDGAAAASDDKGPAAAGSAGQHSEPLSEKLKKQEGVLKPEGNVDPGIHKDPPAASTKDTMPVIIPPGEPGGDQSVQPK